MYIEYFETIELRLSKNKILKFYIYSGKIYCLRNGPF